MQSITNLWRENKEVFKDKNLKQILGFTGEGELKDRNSTSQQFREFLDNIPTVLLKKYGEECLTSSFPGSGYALQDIINQIGTRLDFIVEFGLYRGKKNAIGFDGIWTAKDDYNLIVEVKTTDAYRINLDKISNYRNSLIEQKRISKEKSSILIVVGREDTGDFEAQIRGSRHAWDVRLTSVDSLFQLLELKEKLNDSKTLQQINTLLKPLEYTRIDKLLDLIFITSRDLQFEEENVDILIDDESDAIADNDSDRPRREPVNFHEECVAKVENNKKINLLKNARTTYVDKETKTRFSCSVSKPHDTAKGPKYWFAFHPSQKEYLDEGSTAYVILGCGSVENTFLIPYSTFEPWLKNFWISGEDKRMYWHVVVREIDRKFYILLPKPEKGKKTDITKYRI